MKRCLLLLLFKLVLLSARELPLCHCEERQRRSNLKEGLLRSLRSLAMTRFIAMLAMTSLIFFSLAAQAQTPAEANAWYMSGANPQRTSWVASTADNQTDIPGDLRPEWYIPIEPYIHPKFQVITAYDTVFVSTAKGLYAFNSETGTERWVYPTEFPLGQSPTIYQGVAYVGGMDKKIHAINVNLNGITPGQGLWTFEAKAGFETNPLIIQPPTSQFPILYAGSRDGYMYALDVSNPANASKNRLLWRYQTQGPIRNSAAAKPDNSTIYFASEDSYGYALNTNPTDPTDPNTILVWKTAKLPGEGFGAWWPVYYSHPTEGDYVIFSGTWDYRMELGPGGFRDVLYQEFDDLFPTPRSSTMEWNVPQTATPIPGDWAAGTITRDTSQPNIITNGTTTAVTEYFEEPTEAESTADPAGVNRKAHKPWRRLYLLLNAQNGQEATYDFDNDGQKEYAPITVGGITHYGNRFPTIVGSDNVLYQIFDGRQRSSFNFGSIMGWKINTPYISEPASTFSAASDEPVAFSSGGNRIYVNHARVSGHGFDISNPTGTQDRYYAYYPSPISLEIALPGFDIGYIPDAAGNDMNPFGGTNGAYLDGGYMSSLIPYKGRLYLQVRNSLVAFRLGATNAVKLPTAATVTSQPSTTSRLTKAELQQKLEAEIRKLDINSDGVLDHLKPGFTQSGITNTFFGAYTESLLDYFHHPFETFYTLLRAKPLVQDVNLRAQIDAYLQAEWTNFNPAIINHIGWAEGEWRDDYLKLPEVTRDIANYPKSGSATRVGLGYDDIWAFNPMGWYAMWMYAKEYGNAPTIFQSGVNSSALMRNFTRIMDTSRITDPLLAEYSWGHNGYLAGLIGFLNLYDLALTQGMAPISGNLSANYPYTIQQFRDRKDQLMALRVQNFTKNSPYPVGTYPHDNQWDGQMARALNPSRSFIFMVPEVAEYLRTSTLSCADGLASLNCVQDAVNQFDRITPYWMLAKFDETMAEGVFQPLYDYHSLFQARAQILKQPFEELVKYLDASAFARGDLFYIDNLVAALNAPAASIIIGDLNNDNSVDVLDIQACVNHILGIQDLGSRADVNQDGSVDVLDVQVVVNIILGV